MALLIGGPHAARPAIFLGGRPAPPRPHAAAVMYSFLSAPRATSGAAGARPRLPGPRTGVAWRRVARPCCTLYPHPSRPEYRPVPPADSTQSDAPKGRLQALGLPTLEALHPRALALRSAGVPDGPLPAQCAHCLPRTGPFLWPKADGVVGVPPPPPPPSRRYGHWMTAPPAPRPDPTAAVPWRRPARVRRYPEGTLKVL